MKKIIITMEGGNVTAVLCDTLCEVVIVDYDADMQEKNPNYRVIPQENNIEVGALVTFDETHPIPPIFNILNVKS